MEKIHNPQRRSERHVVIAAAAAACIAALATLAFAGPSDEYSLDLASFDVTPPRVDSALRDTSPPNLTLAMRPDGWHADESASGTRPDSVH
jgi:hypothetical protein